MCFSDSRFESRLNARNCHAGSVTTVEAVYLGLGSAYFVNDGGDLAGVGSPGPNGWEWNNQPELASRVREVIRIYKNERPGRI